MRSTSGALGRPVVPSPAAPCRPASGAVAPALGTVFAGVMRLLLRTGWPLEVRGAERLPVRRTIIVCANHNSHLDSVALLAATAAAGNPHILLAARDYFFDRPLRRALVAAILPIVPIDRDGSLRALAALGQRLQAILADGPKTIVMFPEGGRSPSGRIGRFKAGVGVLAASLGVPVVPALVEGTRHCMPRGRLLPRPGPLRVSFAHPIWPDQQPVVGSWRAESRALARAAEARVEQLAETSDA